MIHSVKFTCVLDTNIIYPIEIRDLLFWFAIDAFRRLVMNRRNPDLDEYQVLDALRKNQLTATADFLHALL